VPQKRREIVAPVPVWVWHTTDDCGRGDQKCATGWFAGTADGDWYKRPGSTGPWRVIMFAGTGGGNHYLPVPATHLRERGADDPPPHDRPT
jgi:hypothetical protein